MAVILIDDCNGTRSMLGAGLVALGYSVWSFGEFAIESIAAVSESIDLVVSEQKIGTQSFFRVFEELRKLAPKAAFAVVTAYPSVANAVKAIRLGCDAYVAKPVAADGLLRALGPPATDDPDTNVGDEAWPSLDRTIWEYLNQVYATAGSLAEAARRLRLDRKSLRRMLTKYPPSH